MTIVILHLVTGRTLLTADSLCGANLREASLSGANLRKSDLRGADLHGADLRWASLRGASLRKSDLRGADLHGADLRGADLREANLRGADLREANLRWASLHGADLRGSDLRGSDLHDSELIEANLHGANLSEASLYGADLSEANLSGVSGLPDAPRIERIDAAILAAIAAGGCLRMSTWHTCATTHCRAGWAITLAGERGAELERLYGPSVAGALIYHASDPASVIPKWTESDEDAMENMCARAIASE